MEKANRNIIDSQYVLNAYFNEQKSIVAIAEELNTYPNKIKRMIIKNGKQLRDKSEAQKLALSSGRHTHPTEGTERPEETKRNIAKGVSKHWHSLSKDEKKRFSDLAKKNWEKITPQKKKEILDAASEGIREAAKNGSKIERFFLTELKLLGYNVIWHANDVVPNTKLVVDLWVPDIATAIEIDGLSHYEPIWGEDSFAQTKRADQEKNGALMTIKANIIRIKSVKKNVSKLMLEKSLPQLLKLLEQASKTHSSSFKMEIK